MEYKPLPPMIPISAGRKTRAAPVWDANECESTIIQKGANYFAQSVRQGALYGKYPRCHPHAKVSATDLSARGLCRHWRICDDELAQGVSRRLVKTLADEHLIADRLHDHGIATTNTPCRALRNSRAVLAHGIRI